MIAASLLLIAGAITLLVMGLWQSSSVLLGASIAASVLAAVVLIVGARRMPVGTAAPARDPDHYDPGPRDAAGRDAGRTDHGRYDPGRRTDTEPLTVVPREPAGASAGDRAAPAGPAALAGPASPAGPAAAAAAAAGPGAGGAAEPLRSAAHEAAAELRQAARGGPTEHVTAAIPTQQAPGQATRAPEVDEPGDDRDVDPPDEPAPQQVSAADAARVGRMLTEVLVVDGRPRYHLPGCVHLLGRECEPLPVGEAIELGFTPCGLCEPDSALLADARRV